MELLQIDEPCTLRSCCGKHVCNAYHILLLLMLTAAHSPATELTVVLKFIMSCCCLKRSLLPGDGHFSPLGGYNEDKDMVLILDTARFKYPSVRLPSLSQPCCCS